MSAACRNKADDLEQIPRVQPAATRASASPPLLPCTEYKRSSEFFATEIFGA